MNKIVQHPVLDVPVGEETIFYYEGKEVRGEKGFSIAAALHRAGYPVHSHSLKNRNRSLECGIGKCGACEMLVDGEIRRICITPVDGVSEVREIPREYHPQVRKTRYENGVKIYKTKVVIIGAGPAGLAARETLNRHGVDTIVIDNNDRIGGQFLMQTHQFFFFEKEKKFGGMRGFDIAGNLAGDNTEGIFLNSTVWDIFEDRRLAVKNIRSREIYYVDAEFLLIATGAVPYMPAFENDDLPGVYTAAVVQKMMNQEFTLLGKNVLTVGAGNIGYLTSYQLMQAGAKVKGILEAQPREGGFPVQANRVRRLGIPIITSHILLKAIPNERQDGIQGAVIAECMNFEPVPGTEKIVEGIDAINICTGLVSDDLLLTKGREVFGRHCLGAGDAIRIGEGTSAVLRGKQAAFEIMEEAGINYNYDEYLDLSKEYIDSQQHPVRVIENPFLPDEEREKARPFVIIDCLYGFACNPCAFACTHGAITKNSTSIVPHIDYDLCTGCMKCVSQCPGLAIFGYDLKKQNLFIPIEYEIKERPEVYLVNNSGEILGEGMLEKIRMSSNKTHVARIKATGLKSENELTDVRGFISKASYPSPIEWKESTDPVPSDSFICHCDDVRLEEILEVVGDRKFISVDEIKHTTRLGMGACRGKRCIKRLKQAIKPYGISVVGEPTPRGPLSNQIDMGELIPSTAKDEVRFSIPGKTIRRVKAISVIAGGGVAGSALFRYMAEAGMKPVLLNYGHGASWRNIAGGRPAFSVPELSEIATANLGLFMELQKKANIDFRKIRYVSFAHDEKMYHELEKSMEWQDSRMVGPEGFQKEISPSFNPETQKYLGALITENCWQASPGKTVDLLRKIGVEKGGIISEDTRLMDVRRENGKYSLTVQDHSGDYLIYETDVFINALGPEGGTFAAQLGMDTGIYPVRHQAFITRRLPMLGVGGEPLSMLIDRRKYKGFVAVYGQQLADTGQIIGCASPAVDHSETGRNLKVNTRHFTEIVAEVFTDWLPELSAVGFQALWSGYYVEPRMIIDPEKGLFIGLRGQGFMLAQYLAKMYVHKLTGKEVPGYFNRLRLEGDGLLETAFK